AGGQLQEPPPRRLVTLLRQPAVDLAGPSDQPLPDVQLGQRRRHPRLLSRTLPDRAVRGYRQVLLHESVGGVPPIAPVQVMKMYSCSVLLTVWPSSSRPSMWKVTRMIPVSVAVAAGRKKGTSTGPVPPAATEVPETGMIW